MSRIVCAFDLPTLSEDMLPRSVRLQQIKGRIELLTAVTAADSVVVVLDLERRDAANMVVMLNEVRPGLPIIGIGSKMESIEEAQRAGCQTFISAPLNADELSGALTQIWSSGTDQSERMHVLGVFGAIGAAGSTTIACHIATELAARHARTLLIDADLEFGGAARAFDRKPEHTIAELAHSANPDLVTLSKSVCDLGGNCALLARPYSIREAHEVDEASMQRVIRLAMRGYPHVVIDLPRRLDALTGAAIELCDKLLVVTQLTVPGLANALQLIQGLEAEGFRGERIEVVINRFRPGTYACTLPMVEQQLSRKPLAVVPNDFQSVNRAIDAGRPLSPNNAVRVAIAELVNRLAPAAPGAAPVAAKSWLGRLGLAGTK